MLERPGALASPAAALALYLEFAVVHKFRVVLALLRGNLVCLLQKLRPHLAQGPRLSAYGVQLHANFADWTFRYCLYGTYGRHLSGYLEQQDAEVAFLDIGANQGLFALIAARNPHIRQVVAIEPVPRTHSLLRLNTLANGVAGKIELVPAALSDRAGVAQIATKAHHSGVASLARRPGGGMGASETIRLITHAELDELLPGDLPIIVKVDVEGHEPTVIGELLKSRHAARIVAIFYEADERWADPTALRAVLEAAGFRRFRKFGINRHYDMLAER